MMKLKTLIAGIYLMVSLLALFCEPTKQNLPLRYFIAYYGIVFLNLLVSAKIMNHLLRKQNETA